MNDLQRNREWYLQRKGKLTASEIYNILSNRKEPMTDDEIAAARAENPKSRVTTKEVPFSQAALSWLDQKVAERYMPDNAYIEYLENCSYESKAMQWGTMFESEAIMRYTEVTGNEILDAPFIPLKQAAKFAGGSPDGILRSGEGIIEAKCPFTPSKHMAFMLMKEPADLLRLNEQYYAQVQYNLICVSQELGDGYDYCDFVSYDPRVTKSRRLKILRIPADRDYQNRLIERTEIAIKYLYERIKTINEMPVFIKQ